MPIVNVQQGSKEWLDLRSTKITSTMSSVIMGCNPFKNKLQLFNELVGLTEPDEPNEKMKLGTELEHTARQKYMEETGVIVKPVVRISDSLSWAMTSLDGESQTGLIIVEIKCGKSAFVKAIQGIIPEYYKCQMQFSLMVTNLLKMHYYCYWEGESVLMTLERDDEYIKAIQRECERFFNDTKVMRPPEIDPFEDIGLSDKEWDENLKSTWNQALKDANKEEK